MHRSSPMMSSPPPHPRRLRLPLRACFLAALLMLPVFAASAGEDVSEMEREMAVERTCEDWQNVRRCADAEGHLQYECVAKSPMARFLAFFRSDKPEDDEVRVIRKAPEPRTQVAERSEETSESHGDDGSPAHEKDGEASDSENGSTRSASSSTTSTATPSTATTSEEADEVDGQYRKVRVKRVVKDLPLCRDSR